MHFKIRSTIKNKIFTFNLMTVLLLMVITAIAFSIAGRNYLERETLVQLHQIAARAGRIPLPPHGPASFAPNDGNDVLISSYGSLLRTLRAPSSIFNVEYALIDKNNNILTPFKDFNDRASNFDSEMVDFMISLSIEKSDNELTFSYEGIAYAAVIKDIKEGTQFDLGKIVIYTNLEKINQIQRAIIVMLLGIFVVVSLIVLLFSNLIAKNISLPLTKLNSHIRELSERKFSSRFQVPADNEIQELVSNINLMAQKLDNYDKSQQTFLQNASHEFRTPIMSIQSYAEGIQYDVIEGHEGARVILDETKRLTHLVEELLYLSRLDAIEENYCHEKIELNGLLKDCVQRMDNIAKSQKKNIILSLPEQSVTIEGDSEKLQRAVINLIHNCIRFATEMVAIKLSAQEPNEIRIDIFDDGPGFSEEDLKNLFTRFYKGSKGVTGLGLAISKSIIEKHRGSLAACNSSPGAHYAVILPE